MNLYLEGKTALISGASQGFGRAIAKALAIEGVKVLATARNEVLLEDLRKEIMDIGGVEPHLFVQDFLLSDGPGKIAEFALKTVGQVDILINNAGQSRAVDIIGAEEEWIAGMNLDFTRHRQLTQLLLPQFVKRREGTILNIGSTYELRSINVSAVAKASLVAWSKQLAGQLGKFGVTVNTIQPGLIDTANTRRIFSEEERRQFSEKEIPLGDFGAPQDIANMAAFLVSPRARYITGSVAVVDGGLRHYPF